MILSGFSEVWRSWVTLGEAEQQKIWNEEKSIFEYVDGDRSLIILLYGIVTIAVLVAALLMIVLLSRTHIKPKHCPRQGKRCRSIKEELENFFNGNLHFTLLSLPVLGTLAFTILPLIFMMSMAFTNYSKEGNKLVLFDWVGLDNFKQIVSFTGSLGQTFWSVLGWTVAWAVIATFLNYFFGMILAMVINWKEIRVKKFWRFCFVLTVAVPHFVTLLIIRQMLQPEGAVNVLLRSLGVIGAGESLPFFTNTTWARTAVILINLWVGAPYVLLQITGILQNIPQELYESAKVDGAGPVTTFRKITLPICFL